MFLLSIGMKLVVRFKVLKFTKCSMFCPESFRNKKTTHQVKTGITQLLLS